MTLPARMPKLPTPTKNYDAGYFKSLLRVLDLYFRDQNAAGPLRGSTLNLSDLQSGGYNLRVGDLYEADGVVRVLREKDIYFDTMPAATASVGSVTIT